MPALHLLVGDPRRKRPLWQLDLVRSRLPRRPTFALPTDVLDARPRGLTLFAADPARENELSSQTDGASGSVTVTRARCSPRPEIALRAHARLGSEFFEGPRVRVEGRIRVLGRAGA